MQLTLDILVEAGDIEGSEVCKLLSETDFVLRGPHGLHINRERVRNIKLAGINQSCGSPAPVSGEERGRLDEKAVL